MTLLVSECWEWPGASRREDRRSRYSAGYGYRILYRLLRDPELPDDLHLHHLCENAWCVNPWHLRPMTLDEHREAHTKVVCVNGHSYDDPANVGVATIRRRHGLVSERYCKLCRAEYRRRRMSDPITAEAVREQARERRRRERAAWTPEQRAAVNARKREQYRQRGTTTS